MGSSRWGRFVSAGKLVRLFFMIRYHQLQLVSSCNWRRRNLPKSILSRQCWYSTGSASTGISAVTWSLLECLNCSIYIHITRKCSPFRAHKEGAWLIQKIQTFPYWSSPDFSALAELTETGSVPVSIHNISRDECLPPRSCWFSSGNTLFRWQWGFAGCFLQKDLSYDGCVVMSQGKVLFLIIKA